MIDRDHRRELEPQEMIASIPINGRPVPLGRSLARHDPGAAFELLMRDCFEGTTPLPLPLVATSDDVEVWAAEMPMACVIRVINRGAEAATVGPIPGLWCSGPITVEGGQETSECLLKDRRPIGNQP